MKKMVYIINILAITFLLLGEAARATAQISDTFIFKGEEYSLIGIAGGKLFSPKQYGMEPVMIHTGCYRGFYVFYEITDKGIYLRKLTMREKDGNYKPINGILPDKERYQVIYRNVNLLVPFTGNIRLAKDFIQELYIHMGFQKPTSFKTVFDLQFEDGNLVEIKDRSKEMEAKRADFKKRFEKLSKDGHLIQGIDESFSLDMSIE